MDAETIVRPDDGEMLREARGKRTAGESSKHWLMMAGRQRGDE